ncbi:MAG: sigma-70 family RNA polymerase sigma factor [Planctomycetes bacterium]|nr:sigma-70 family RNA polymerase sigma factor [Planctomycetota bacterium]
MERSHSELEGLLADTAWTRALARRLVRDAHAAEDLAQEAWLVATRRGSASGLELRALLRGILRNLVRDRRRSEARRRHREETVARSEGDWSPQRVLERAEVQRELAARVLALDEPYRTTLLLRWFDELSPGEIARAQHVPLDTVKSRLARGLELLRGDLERRSPGRSGDWLSALVLVLDPPSAPPWILGGLAVKKLALAGLVLLILGFAWWRIAESGTAERPNEDVRVVAGSAASPSTTELAAPDLDARTASSVPVPAAPVVAVDPERVLSGRVVDPQGQPVAEAEVQVVRDEWSGRNRLSLHREGEQRTIAVARTEADGGFAFELPPARPHLLCVSARGFATQWTQERRAGEFVLVELAPGARIHGRVLTESDRRPVAGAQVTVRLRPRRTQTMQAFTAVSDERGEYELTGLFAGTAWIDVSDARLVGITGFERWLGPGEDWAQDFVLADGARVHGVVTDAATGAPIEGALVDTRTTGPAKSTRTDALGRYELLGLERGPTAYVELRVTAEGFACGRSTFLTHGRADVEADVALSPGHRARGRVLDRSGAPVADARVAANADTFTLGLPAIAEQVVQRTDEQGRFELAHLGPGHHHVLSIVKDGYGTLVFEFPDDEAARAIVEFGDLVLEPARRVIGRFADPAGRPLSGWNVELDGENADRGRFGGKLEDVAGRRASVRSCVTDERGRFGFDDLCVGEYTIDGWIKGSKAHAERAFLVAETDVVDLGDITVDPGFAIEGVLLDPERRPVFQAVISALSPTNENEQLSYTVTEVDGSFRLGGLAVESVVLFVDRGFSEIAPGRVPDWAPILLRGVTAPRRGMEIVFEHAQPIRGRALLPDGSAATSTMVVATVEGFPNRTGTVGWTDAEGHFAVLVPPRTRSELRAERVEALTGSGGERVWTTIVERVESGTKDLELRLVREP